ncbi:hypothetical protein C8P68_11222 [Mucilaginibacter yixingensis]|uniref:Uncharacterized protein n=2 Tax=Mucilaginibacter yixingensis TaxID=1295612 RepID=A0A2T5J4J6_9SPHI|nr:hypothetical protein C8P68_11222 [Mucilaginibacter yixingensis]
MLPIKDRVRESIYNHFLPQCDQFGLSEEDFYKLVLKPAFREADPAPEEDPDPPNSKGTSVKLFGTTIHSLKRLGEVLFEDPVRQQIYLEDSTLLKAHVDQLADADTAIAFALLYKSEADIEKRYLKICYRLNPGLPYRIKNQLFGQLPDLIDAAFAEKALMDQLYADFGQGRLHLWLHERDPQDYPVIPVEKKAAAFLTFIYNVNSAFPFAISGEFFYSPIELVAKAQKDLSFWPKLLTQCATGHLFIWFKAQGYPGWQDAFQKNINRIKWKKAGEDNHKDYTLIQQLLLLIDPDTICPQLAFNETKVELLALPATQTVEVILNVRLKTLGYVKAQIQLESEQPGITLDQSQIILFDLTGQNSTSLTLRIDPLKFGKNVLHQTSLQLVTDYENISLPVSINVVFPIRSYVLYLLKYAAFGALFFGVMRWLIAAGRGTSKGLPSAIINQQVGRSLPDNWPLFYWVFLLMLLSLLGSFLWIKKAEKI